MHGFVCNESLITNGNFTNEISKKETNLMIIKTLERVFKNYYYVIMRNCMMIF